MIVELIGGLGEATKQSKNHHIGLQGPTILSRSAAIFSLAMQFCHVSCAFGCLNLFVSSFDDLGTCIAAHTHTRVSYQTITQQMFWVHNLDVVREHTLLRRVLRRGFSEGLCRRFREGSQKVICSGFQRRVLGRFLEVGSEKGSSRRCSEGRNTPLPLRRAP